MLSIFSNTEHYRNEYIATRFLTTRAAFMDRDCIHSICTLIATNSDAISPTFLATTPASPKMRKWQVFDASETIPSKISFKRINCDLDGNKQKEGAYSFAGRWTVTPLRFFCYIDNSSKRENSRKEKGSRPLIRGDTRNQYPRGWVDGHSSSILPAVPKLHSSTAPRRPSLLFFFPLSVTQSAMINWYKCGALSGKTEFLSQKLQVIKGNALSRTLFRSS